MNYTECDNYVKRLILKSIENPLYGEIDWYDSAKTYACDFWHMDLPKYYYKKVKDDCLEVFLEYIKEHGMTERDLYSHTRMLP